MIENRDISTLMRMAVAKTRDGHHESESRFFDEAGPDGCAANTSQKNPDFAIAFLQSLQEPVVDS